MSGRHLALSGVVLFLVACSAEKRLLDGAQAASEAELVSCDIEYAKHVGRKFDEVTCDRSQQSMARARLELEKIGISDSRINAVISMGKIDAQATLDTARRTWERENPSIVAQERKAAQDLASASADFAIYDAIQENQQKDAEIVKAAEERERRMNMEVKVACTTITNEIITNYRLLPPDSELPSYGSKSAQQISSSDVCGAVVETKRLRSSQPGLATTANVDDIEARHDPLKDSANFVLSMENRTDKVIANLVMSCVGSYFDANGALVFKKEGNIYGILLGETVRKVSPGKTEYVNLRHGCAEKSIPFARSEVRVKIDAFSVVDPSCDVGMSSVTCPGDTNPFGSTFLGRDTTQSGAKVIDWSKFKSREPDPKQDPAN